MALPPGWRYGALFHRSVAATDAAKSLAQLLTMRERDHLVDVVVQVNGAAVYTGDNTAQAFEVAAGTELPFDLLPLGDLFVKNKTGGSTGTLVLLGFKGRKVAAEAGDDEEGMARIRGLVR